MSSVAMFQMPNGIISKMEIIIRKKNESCLLPSNEEEAASVGASASGVDAMVRAWLEEPWVFWAVLLVLVILRFLPAATSARDGAS